VTRLHVDSQCKHGCTDRGPACSGDSWRPKKHCISRESPRIRRCLRKIISTFCCWLLAEDKRIPSFSGSSYMLLRRVQYVSRDVSIVMRFKPLRPDGMLLYTAQYDDGRGDFMSLALRHGYLEFRSATSCILS